MSTEEERKARREDPVYQANLAKKWKAELIIENKRTMANAIEHDRINGITGNWAGHVNAVKFFQGAQ